MTGAELPGNRRLPLTDRLSPQHGRYARILAAHEGAMRSGSPGYADPVSGTFVFTAAEHWERGACCNSGCRHCPFDEGPRGPQARRPDASGARPGPRSPR